MSDQDGHVKKGMEVLEQLGVPLSARLRDLVAFSVFLAERDGALRNGFMERLQEVGSSPEFLVLERVGELDFALLEVWLYVQEVPSPKVQEKEGGSS